MNSTARAQLNEHMRRLADGDRSAFEPVYASLWAPVRAFCSRALTGLDGEDAAQQALLKMFSRASSFDPSGDALTWALSFAAWECRTVRRRRVRARIGDVDANGAVDARVDGNPTPEAAVIEAELEAAALEVLGALSEADRATLMTTMCDEVPSDVGAATFRKRRERAMTRLREAWRKVYGS